DAEHACSRSCIELEHDAERDHLALAGRERVQRCLELRRQSLGQRLVITIGYRRKFFAAQASPLGAEVVERDPARELAEPRPRRAAPLVESVPQAEGALERLRREVLGDEAV